jgi:hypothetical protein
MEVKDLRKLLFLRYDFDFISHFSSNEMGDQPQPLMRSQKKMFLSHENLVGIIKPFINIELKISSL